MAGARFPIQPELAVAQFNQQVHLYRKKQSGLNVIVGESALHMLQTQGSVFEKTEQS